MHSCMKLSGWKWREKMNKYELKMILLSELTIEQVEYLFTELINDKVGVFISGRGEEL